MGENREFSIGASNPVALPITRYSGTRTTAFSRLFFQLR
jgi:hypothetical protein